LKESKKKAPTVVNNGDNVKDHSGNSVNDHLKLKELKKKLSTVVIFDKSKDHSGNSVNSQS
jgi:hypothetical protein